MTVFKATSSRLTSRSNKCRVKRTEQEVFLKIVQEYVSQQTLLWKLTREQVNTHVPDVEDLQARFEIRGADKACFLTE